MPKAEGKQPKRVLDALENLLETAADRDEFLELKKAFTELQGDQQK